MHRHIAQPRDGQQLLSSRQAATWLGISERTLWTLANSGELPRIKLLRSVKFDLDDLRELVERNKKGAAE